MTIDLSNPAHLLVTATVFLVFSVVSNHWGTIVGKRKEHEFFVASTTILSWLTATAAIFSSILKLVSTNW